MLLVRLTLAAIVSLLPIVLEGSYGLPLTGDEAETFLHDARIVGMKPIGVGITKPMKVTLSDGERTHHAVFKSIDEVRHGVVRGAMAGSRQPSRIPTNTKSRPMSSTRYSA